MKKLSPLTSFFISVDICSCLRFCFYLVMASCMFIPYSLGFYLVIVLSVCLCIPLPSSFLSVCLSISVCLSVPRSLSVCLCPQTHLALTYLPLLLSLTSLSPSLPPGPLTPSYLRCQTPQANSNDDNGVLEGRWTETYPKNSTVPWAWSGSVKILDQFMSNKKPVQYGQCWVFSGLVTTRKFMVKRGRERERERDRQTDRHRQTDRQTDRQTERHRESSCPPATRTVRTVLGLLRTGHHP